MGRALTPRAFYCGGRRCEAGRFDRLWGGGVKVSALRSTLFCACATAAFVAFPGAIISLFSSDSSAVAMASSALETNSALFAFFGMGAEYALLHLALGRSFGGLFLSIGRQGPFYVPACSSSQGPSASPGPSSCGQWPMPRPAMRARRDSGEISVEEYLDWKRGFAER